MAAPDPICDGLDVAGDRAFRRSNHDPDGRDPCDRQLTVLALSLVLSRLIAYFKVDSHEWGLRRQNAALDLGLPLSRSCGRLARPSRPPGN